MSDSGFTSIISNASLSQSGRGSRAETPSFGAVEIIKAPEDIRSSRSATSLKGHVERRDHNGYLHIKTDKGDVTVKPPPDSDLKVGDSVEIKIQPQNSENTAQIRQRPLQEQNIAPTQPPTNTTIDYNENLTNFLSKQPLTTNEPLQLVPLTAAQIKTIVSLPIITLPPTLLQSHPVALENTIELTATPTPLTLSIQVAVPFVTEDFQNQFINPAPITSEDSENTFSSWQTRADIFNSAELLPLRSVITQIIKTPIESLVTFSNTEPQKQSLAQTHSSMITQIISQDSAFFSDLDVGSEQQIHSDLPRYARAGQVEARLIGMTPEREFPVLKILSQGHTSEHFFSIARHFQDIPQGSLLLLSPVAPSPEDAAKLISTAQQQPLAPLLPTLPLSPLSGLPPLWDSADEIYQTLLHHSPMLAQNMAGVTPNTAFPARMSATALFFIAALRSGDMQSWIGDKTIDALKRAGKSDLFTRFSKETTDLGRTENIGQEWRSTAFPVIHGENIHRIILHYRNEHKQQNEAAEQGGGTTRFVMDLSLSKMGKIQLDGLFQGNETKGIGRLDLILRTENPFSQPMHAQMRQVYKAALDETSYTGELSFQSTPDQWVRITPSVASGNYSKNI